MSSSVQWPGGDGRPCPGNQALCHPSLSRRWSGGGGWGRSRLPGGPSSPALTTRLGPKSTTRCRYPAGAGYREEEASRLGGCLPHSGCVFCPQDVALAPEFLAAAEYSMVPGADLQGLLQQLETVSGEVLAHDLAGLRGGRWGVPVSIMSASKNQTSRGWQVQEQGIGTHSPKIQLFSALCHT